MLRSPLAITLTRCRHCDRDVADQLRDAFFRRQPCPAGKPGMERNRTASAAVWLIVSRSSSLRNLIKMQPDL